MRGPRRAEEERRARARGWCCCLGCTGLLAAPAAVSGVVVAAVALRGPAEVAPDASVEFTARAPDAGRFRAVAERGDRYDDGADWPTYGGDDARTRYLPLPDGVRPLRPPLRQVWGQTGRVLLEFPPVLCGRRLYLLKNNAALYAVDRRTGRATWKRRMGHLAASAPACRDGRVVVTVLERGRGVRAGRVASVRARDGATIWSRPLAARTESSPLLAGGKVVLGTEDGQVLALRARDGGVVWRRRVDGAVKAAVTRTDGALYVGDYAGTLTSLWLRSGRVRWRAPGGGRIYGTASAAYGRVFVTDVRGAISAHGQRTGRLAWRRRTDGFAYAAPAVAPVAGRGPTVFAGSYGGRFYALDARTGRTRWTRATGGRISGGATVLGDLVLYANLGRKRLQAVRARDGAPVWSFRTGAFDPGIGDGRRLYVNGYSSLYHFTPRARARRDARSLRRAAAARRAARRARAER